jgi:Skp family chaperone for outer membrane proteins
MEWLICATLYYALGISTAAYAIAQIDFGFWVPRLTQSLKQVQELTDENEQVKQLNENLQTDIENAVKVQCDTKRENARLKQEFGENNERLTAERDALKQENGQLRESRDGQIKMRCKTLSDRRDAFLDGWEYDDFQNQEAMRANTANSSAVKSRK